MVSLLASVLVASGSAMVIDKGSGKIVESLFPGSTGTAKLQMLLPILECETGGRQTETRLDRRIFLEEAKSEQGNLNFLAGSAGTFQESERVEEAPAPAPLMPPPPPAPLMPPSPPVQEQEHTLIVDMPGLLKESTYKSWLGWLQDGDVALYSDLKDVIMDTVVGGASSDKFAGDLLMYLNSGGWPNRDISIERTKVLPNQSGRVVFGGTEVYKVKVGGAERAKDFRDNGEEVPMRSRRRDHPPQQKQKLGANVASDDAKDEKPREKDEKPREKDEKPMIKEKVVPMVQVSLMIYVNEKMYEPTPAGQWILSRMQFTDSADLDHSKRSMIRQRIFLEASRDAIGDSSPPSLQAMSGPCLTQEQYLNILKNSLGMNEISRHKDPGGRKDCFILILETRTPQPT